MKNPRINGIFEKETAGIVANIAQQEHKSVGLFRELALEALEMREDLYLSYAVVIPSDLSYH